MRHTAPAKLLSTVLCALLLANLAAGCTPAMRGSIALANGDYAQALARYNEALQEKPDSLYLRQRIALTYFAMKDYSQAEASFLDILNRAPGEPNALFYLGLTRIGKGERQAALTALTAFHWEFKFYQQKFVQEEARRLLKHPDMPADETIRDLKDALALGIMEQDRIEREMLNMHS
jgi:tetratricopeptide (TPR) repeat protein